MILHATVHRVTPTAKTVQMGKMIVLFNTPDSALIVMRIQLWIKSVSIVVLVNRSSVKYVQVLIQNSGQLRLRQEILRLPSAEGLFESDHWWPYHNTVRSTGYPDNFESYSACLNPVRPTDDPSRSDPPLTTAEPGPTTAGPSKSNCTMKTFWKCWWFWLIIALLIILVSLICHPL